MQLPYSQRVLEEENISSGTFPCLSHTDSEVQRCNTRILNHSDSGVSRKIWNSIARLGVVSGINDSSSINQIEDLERRDNSETEGKKALKNVLL